MNHQYNHFVKLFNLDEIAAFAITFQVTDSEFTVQTPWITPDDMRESAYHDNDMSRIAGILVKAHPGHPVRGVNGTWLPENVEQMEYDDALKYAYIADAIMSLTNIQYLGSIWTKTVVGQMRLLNPRHVQFAEHVIRTTKWLKTNAIPTGCLTTGPLFYVQPAPKGIVGHK